MAKRPLKAFIENFDEFAAMYPNTDNRTIAHRFGCSETQVQTFASSRGLRKTSEYKAAALRRASEKGVDAMKASKAFPKSGGNCRDVALSLVYQSLGFPTVITQPAAARRVRGVWSLG